MLRTGFIVATALYNTRPAPISNLDKSHKMQETYPKSIEATAKPALQANRFYLWIFNAISGG